VNLLLDLALIYTKDNTVGKKSDVASNIHIYFVGPILRERGDAEQHLLFLS
jgi:hypothetical protein